MEYAPYIIISGIIGLAFAYWLGRNIKKQDSGNEKMREISRAIHEGAMAFLFREYKILVVFVIIVAGVPGYFISYITAIFFFCGAILSKRVGFLGPT